MLGDMMMLAFGVRSGDCFDQWRGLGADVTDKKLQGKFWGDKQS